jgi:hypothetical protein
MSLVGLEPITPALERVKTVMPQSTPPLIITGLMSLMPVPRYELEGEVVEAVVPRLATHAVCGRQDVSRGAFCCRM